MNDEPLEPDPRPDPPEDRTEEPDGAGDPAVGARDRDSEQTDRDSAGRAPRGARPVDPDRPCLNCGDPTPGEYCPTCGQRKVDVKVSVRTLVMEVLEDQFILDKRLPRTLGALLFKPGHMTVEHVDGRIVRYIHPFRLYLVTSLLFFVLLSFFSLRLVRRATEEAPGPTVTAVADSLTGELAALDSAVARIDRQVADTTNSSTLRNTLTVTRSRLVRQRDVLAAKRDSLAPFLPDATADAGAAAGGAVPSTPRAAADTTVPRPGDESETLGARFNWDDSTLELQTGWAAADSALAGQVRRLADMEPREAAETLLGTFFNYAPTMMFILLPVFAGVLKLLYIRRRRYYAEHFVFLLHVHSFVFILATLILVLGNWVGGWLELALGLWILVYIYLAMKRFYGQGWGKTFAKYWILGWMYFWILVFSIPAAFVATLFLF